MMCPLNYASKFNNTPQLKMLRNSIISHVSLFPAKEIREIKLDGFMGASFDGTEVTHAKFI